MMRLLAIVTTCMLLSAAQAQVGETVATPFQAHADKAKGAHLRQEVNELVRLARTKQLTKADSVASELRKKFESSFDPTMRQYAFQSTEEYTEFKSTSAQKFERIDWGYKVCLQMQAFIAAERRDYSAALLVLDTMEGIAPISAAAAVERGYVLNQFGKPEEGLAAYKHAHLLTTRYRSQLPFQAAALRGMGFALIELQRLDEAESAFQNSLSVEPDNGIALHELAYIRDLRGRRPAPK